MSFTLRQLRHARPLLAGTRSFSSSLTVRDAVGTTPPAKKPVGGIRGGIIGFLFGFSVASSFAAYNLLDEYQRASAALQASVEELKVSTSRVTEHVRRIEVVEKDLAALKQSSVSKDEQSKLRTESKKVYDGLHVELLDLRSQVWGVQQDIQALQKKLLPNPPPPATRI